jgi:hypothetical protein
MKPTVGQVLSRARSHLADVLSESGEEFTDQILYPFFGSAYESMQTDAAYWNLPTAENSATVILPAGTKVLDPQGAANDCGVVFDVAERSPGAVEEFEPMAPISKINDYPMTDSLRYYEWTGSLLKFAGATQDRELRISYYANGASPTGSDSTVAFDGSLNFLALKTAALALEPREEGADLSQRLEARADRELDKWATIALRQKQATTIVRPRFRSGRRR